MYGGRNMPKKQKRPCSYPGCPELTDGRYCEKHASIMNKQGKIKDMYGKIVRVYFFCRAC